MIKTDEFGVVTVGGMIDSLFSEYAAAGRARRTKMKYECENCGAFYSDEGVA